jgi:hypothetical protein
MRRPAIAVGLLLAATAANANCVSQRDCTGDACRQVPICDSSIHVVPPQTSSVPPISPPSVQSIAPPTVHPVVASRCAPRNVCNGNTRSLQLGLLLGLLLRGKQNP